MSTLPTTTADLDANHTAGHNATNAQVNTNSRPATVNVVSHSGSGALALNALSGHVAEVTVGANITSFTTPTGMVDGLPFLLILKGNGVAAFTADLSNINIDAATTLNDSLAIAADSIYHILFTKSDTILWAPAGVLSYSDTSGGGGGGASSIALIDTGELDYTGSTVTSIIVPINGAVSGYLLEVLVSTQEATDPGAPTTPAGWTQKWSVGADAAYRPRLTKYYKISDGTETDVTITVPSSRPVACSHTWSNVDNVTPYDVASASVVVGSSNPDPPSITPVSDNSVIVVTAAGNISGGTTSTVSTGYTKGVDQAADDRSHVTCYKLLATAAADNPSAYTWAIDNSTVVTDALRQAT